MESNDDPLAPWLPRITCTLRDTIRSRTPNRAIPRALAFLRAVIALADECDAGGWTTRDKSLATIAAAAGMAYATARRALADLKETGFLTPRGHAAGGDLLTFRVRIETLSGAVEVVPIRQVSALTSTPANVSALTSGSANVSALTEGEGGVRALDLSTEEEEEENLKISSSSSSKPSPLQALDSRAIGRLLVLTLDAAQCKLLQLCAQWQTEMVGGTLKQPLSSAEAEQLLGAVLAARHLRRKLFDVDAYVAKCLREGVRTNWILDARALIRDRQAHPSRSQEVIR